MTGTSQTLEVYSSLPISHCGIYYLARFAIRVKNNCAVDLDLSENINWGTGAYD